MKFLFLKESGPRGQIQSAQKISLPADNMGWRTENALLQGENCDFLCEIKISFLFFLANNAQGTLPQGPLSKSGKEKATCRGNRSGFGGFCL